MPASVLSLLRTATRASHAALEEQVRIAELAREPASYRRLLAAFLGWYEPQERAREQWPWDEAGLDLSSRYKTGWLREDLQALGLSPEAVAALPRAAHLPLPASFGEAFGAAYVMEGATLGGRQIRGLLAGGPIPAEAQHFFRSYGEAVGERWQEFTARLEAFAEKTGSAAAVVAGAEAAFRSLQQWLAQNHLPS